MGSRKRIRAEQLKEQKKTLYMAKLNNNPTSPRKTRYTADLIRGLDVDKALAILQYSHREAAPKLHKLLRSAIANWQNKNEGLRMEDAKLYVKEIFVDGGVQLKRLRPAPQGRGYRIRKRSNHVTLILGSRVAQPEQVKEVESESENK
ncbi:MAG: 50S ribosomal protein L22 [Bacteroidales bacterium]|nr:50S ribosomal protein L22 [Bacteroidales bacterium]MDE5736412.1 50S ribosomal protein L22 [Bacteroidales bacterium]MDE6105878.1 50S ribosomal protein L22 [Bacteroidales bacterium]MDE6308343.1 50S ribosomal protein L22 [Bacteroidales bacterium]MDE6441065.1 50S ribosomal protein L22 [Bacteroidales bacterium]